jgi:hypothetical protein
LGSVVVRASGSGKVLECMLDPTDVECNAGTMRGDMSLLVVLVDVLVVGSCLIEAVVELVDNLVVPDRIEAFSGTKQSIISFTMSAYAFM